MANPWLRLYTEFAHDPKMQSMSEAMQRRFVMLLCLQGSEQLQKLESAELAFALHLSEVELAETHQLFLSKNLVDERWNILSWNERQYFSDCSSERSRRFRERQRNVAKTEETVAATTPEAETETDSEAETHTLSRGVRAPAQVQADFEQFWQAYPRKESRTAARRAFEKLQPDAELLARILAALSWQRSLPAWRERRYVPYAANWLADQRWEDAGPPTFAHTDYRAGVAANAAF